MAEKEKNRPNDAETGGGKNAEAANLDKDTAARSTGKTTGPVKAEAEAHVSHKSGTGADLVADDRFVWKNYDDVRFFDKDGHLVRLNPV